MKKRVIIAINVDNQIDLITNSSSELFVLKGNTKEVVEEMILNLYPEYRNEYAELKNINELSAEELDMYMSYMCSPHCWPATMDMYPVPKGFKFNELYEKEEGRNGWRGEDQYRLKNNVENPRHPWDRSFVTDENREEIVNKLSPKGDVWFLFSLDENPNWDMQELLMTVGERYHLG